MRTADASLPSVSLSLNARAQRLDPTFETLIPMNGGVFDVAHALRADGFDASEDGTGLGTPLVPTVAPCLTQNYAKQPDNSDTNAGPMLVPVAFSVKDHGADAGAIAPTLRSGGHDKSHANGGVMPAVAFQEAQTGVREYDTAGCLRADGPGHDPVGTRVREGMAVRRLTPRECERLQGFPSSRDHAIIDLCVDHQSGVVSVDLSCRRSLNAASPVAADESPLYVSAAEPLSTTSRASREPHVLAHVRMHSVAELQELHSHGRLIWCAGSVGASVASLPRTESESIAAAVVQHLPVVVTAIMAGKAGLPASIRLSMPERSGGRRAATCGEESGVSASDAENAAMREKFTTSDLGRLTPLDDSSAATSLCSVLSAISGCIPSETLGATFSAEIVADIPYTLIPYRGKPAADGPKYKALVNSMAVPVMRWIGQRIQLVATVVNEHAA